MTPIKDEIEELSENLKDKEEILGKLSEELIEQEKLTESVAAIDALKIMPIK